MRRLIAALLAVLAAAALTLTMATPAQAAGEPVVDPTGTADGAETETEHDDAADVELPENIEELTAKAMRQHGGGARGAMWPCFFGIGSCGRASTDTGYLDCADITVDDIGVSWAANQGYDSIHIAPTDLGRAGSLTSPAATISAAWAMYHEARSCLRNHSLTVTVRSWTAIWQQIHCHIVYQLVGGGGSWDLEGHRSASAGYLRPWKRCAW